jgi:fatty-acyl-CoA synthase
MDGALDDARLSQAAPLLSPQPANNASRDALDAWRRALERTAAIGCDPPMTFPLLIEDLADRFEDAPALLDEWVSLSYRELAERANRYARWAIEQELKSGDVVCLMAPNCPDYIAIWTGLTRVGVVVALINTNLIDEALIHAFKVADPRHIIVDAAYSDAFLSIGLQQAGAVQCWAHGGPVSGLLRIEDQLTKFSGNRVGIDECAAPSLTSRALLIYTSGTTGMPKAANVSHLRVMQWGNWFAGMMDTRPSDRMYNCLPMYHSVGGIVATAATLIGGGSVVLRPGFSASRFWSEIVAWDCTLFQYIGELCRYLIDGPFDPKATAHKLRLCCGNGMRGNVWEVFKQRFQIPQILEFYAATEGSFSLYNCEGEPGSIGRIPSFLRHRFGVELVRFDAETETPLRAEDGLCVRCATDEVGEAIGRIGQPGEGGRFEGYSDAEATQKKILRNVFVEGDAWFRTGDLMRKDRRGYFFFMDRVGDTFRWKGENVSSQEVAEAIAGCPGVLDAVVYGVTVPGAEGRAGMSALVVTPDFDLDMLRRHLQAKLPEYARPLFFRLCASVEKTSTFKPRKQGLALEGYDPALTADRIFFHDRRQQEFIPVDADFYLRIQAQQLRL